MIETLRNTDNCNFLIEWNDRVIFQTFLNKILVPDTKTIDQSCQFVFIGGIISKDFGRYVT